LKTEPGWRRACARFNWRETVAATADERQNLPVGRVDERRATWAGPGFLPFAFVDDLVHLLHADLDRLLGVVARRSSGSSEV
jgi:hypothetical protein